MDNEQDDFCDYPEDVCYCEGCGRDLNSYDSSATHALYVVATHTHLALRNVTGAVILMSVPDYMRDFNNGNRGAGQKL